MTEFAEQWAKGAKKEEMVQVSRLFEAGGAGALDQINMRKLDEYLTKSKIARKVCRKSYFRSLPLTSPSPADWRLLRQSRRTEDGARCATLLLRLDLRTDSSSAGRQAVRADATRALHQIQQFILSLAHADRDGRVLLTKETKRGADSTSDKVEVVMKYLLLAPSESFRDVAEEASSVILAGGTMAPVCCACFRVEPYC